MVPDITIGATREHTFTVGDEHAIIFMGLNGPRVLSTPMMILAMEQNSRNLVLTMLEKGSDTVGTHVNIYHRAAAHLGDTVTATSEITGIDRRRVHFRVEMRRGDKLIGEGTHERAIINVAEFRDRRS